MKNVRVVAAIIIKNDKVFATQRGYGEWKGWWEFPGGKIESGEMPEEALKREIREELAIEIEIQSLFAKVEYDYPSFHLSMDCFICNLCDKEPILIEHEDAKWLEVDELDSVKWLPSDLEIIEKMKVYLNSFVP